MFHRGESSGSAAAVRDPHPRRPKTWQAHREAFRRFAPEVALDTIAYTEGGRARARRSVRRSRAATGRVVEPGRVRTPTGSSCVSKAARRARGGRPRSRLSARAGIRMRDGEAGEMTYDYEKIWSKPRCEVESSGDDPAAPHGLRSGRSATAAPAVPEPDGRGRFRRSGSIARRRRGAALGDSSRTSPKPSLSRRPIPVRPDACTTWEKTTRSARPSGSGRSGRRPAGRGACARSEETRCPMRSASLTTSAHDLVADTSRIRRELGFREPVGRREGLQPLRAAETARLECQTGRARRRTRPIPRISSPAARTSAPT